MKISIVIIVRNEEGGIGRCLDSILKQGMELEYEVLVVDGASNDNTVAIVQEYVEKYDFIKLKQCEQYGYSYQRNVGAKLALGEYILYVSGDTILSPKLLKKYLNYMDDYDVIQGTIVNVSDGRKYSNIMKDVYPVFYFESLGTESETFSTVNVAIKRSLILNRPFDETLNSFEDKEWFFHHEGKVRFRRLRSGAVYHTVHENFRQYGRKIYKEALALGRIGRRNKAQLEVLNFYNWFRYSKTSYRILLLSILSMTLVSLVSKNAFFMLLVFLIFSLYKGLYVSRMVRHCNSFQQKWKIGSLCFIYLDDVLAGIFNGLYRSKGNG